MAHDRPDLTTLTALLDDRSIPGTVRADLGDWLSRYQTARQLLEQLRTAGDRARQQLDTAKRDAPLRLTGALATGKVTPELVGADLPALRLVLDTAQDRYAITDRAVALCALELRRPVFQRGALELLPWVAHQRASVPWWEPAPAAAQLIWDAISSQFQITLPHDALTVQGDAAPRYLPPVLRLAVDAHHRQHSQHPWDRHQFAWDCIAADQLELTPQPDRPDGRHSWKLRLTGDWDQRAPLPPAPTAAPARARR